MKIYKTSNTKQLENLVINLIKTYAKSTKDKKITIALSGGTTPGPVYSSLSKADLPFKKLEFYQVDERYVPKTSNNSNYKLIKNTLEIPEFNKKFHHFDTSLPEEESIKKYEEILPDKINITILGMGLDGHTASLFPHSKALKETKRKVAITKLATKNFEIKTRLTITFKIIENSNLIILLLKGKEKLDFFKELLTKLGIQKNELTKTDKEIIEINKISPPNNTDLDRYPILKILTNKNLHVFLTN